MQFDLCERRRGLETECFGSPLDVLWRKLSHRSEDPSFVMGHGGSRQGFVMINRGSYWQAATSYGRVV